MRIERLLSKAGLPVVAALLAAGLSAAVVRTYVDITDQRGPGTFTPSYEPVIGSTRARILTPTTAPAAPADGTAAAPPRPPPRRRLGPERPPPPRHRPPGPARR